MPAARQDVEGLRLLADYVIGRHYPQAAASDRPYHALLDQVIAAHAAVDGVTYRSAIGSWTGHAVCSSSAWLNGLNLFNTGESYHPNKAGHSAGYLALLTAVTG